MKRINYAAFGAEEYDQKIRQTLPYYEDFYEQVLDILNVLKKKQVAWLDIGCGTGTCMRQRKKGYLCGSLCLQIFQKECWNYQKADFRQRATVLK